MKGRQGEGVNTNSGSGVGKALSRLDYLLEQLERANLAELWNPPSGVVRELIEGGLSNPVTYTNPSAHRDRVQQSGTPDAGEQGPLPDSRSRL
jgi:hypothetical protein